MRANANRRSFGNTTEALRWRVAHVVAVTGRSAAGERFAIWRWWIGRRRIIAIDQTRHQTSNTEKKRRIALCKLPHGAIVTESKVLWETSRNRYQRSVSWQPVLAHVRAAASNVPFAILISCTPLMCKLALMIICCALTTVPWHSLHFMRSSEMCLR